MVYENARGPRLRKPLQIKHLRSQVVFNFKKPPHPHTVDRERESMQDWWPPLGV